MLSRQVPVSPRSIGISPRLVIVRLCVAAQNPGAKQQQISARLAYPFAVKLVLQHHALAHFASILRAVRLDVKLEVSLQSPLDFFMLLLLTLFGVQPAITASRFAGTRLRDCSFMRAVCVQREGGHAIQGIRIGRKRGQLNHLAVVTRNQNPVAALQMEPQKPMGV